MASSVDWYNDIKGETGLGIVDRTIGSVASYNTYLEFPNVPDYKYREGIFIDVSENKIYRWDGNDCKYYCVGSDYSDIKIIDGGDATNG